MQAGYFVTAPHSTPFSLLGCLTIFRQKFWDKHTLNNLSTFAYENGPIVKTRIKIILVKQNFNHPTVHLCIVLSYTWWLIKVAMSNCYIVLTYSRFSGRSRRRSRARMRRLSFVFFVIIFITTQPISLTQLQPGNTF